MNIYDFALLCKDEKISALKNARFCDAFNDGPCIVYVYYLGDFFVEEVTKEGLITDILPFKRGYKVPANCLKNNKRNSGEYDQAA